MTEWNIGAFTIQSFGFFVAIGILSAIFLSLREARRNKIDGQHIYNLIVPLLIGSLAGGHLIFLLLHPGTTPLRFWEGSMSWLGALLGGSIVVWAYTSFQGHYFWKYADMFATPAALGLALGNLYLLVEPSVGGVSDLLASIVILAVMLVLRKRKVRHGHRFSLFVMMYAAQRFMFDLIYAEPTFLALTGTQWLCMIAFVTLGGYISSKLGSVRGLFFLY